MNYHEKTPPTYQTGLALLTFTLFLMVCTIGIFSSSQSVALQQKISANYHQARNCLQSSETAALVATNDLSALNYSKFVDIWQFEYPDIIPLTNAPPTKTKIIYRYSAVPAGYSFGVGVTANHFDARAEAAMTSSRCPLSIGFYRLSPS